MPYVLRCACSRLSRRATDDHLINQAVVAGFLTTEEAVPVGILLDARQRLPGMFAHDLVQLFPYPQNLTSMNPDITRLTFHAAPGLMNHDASVGKSVALSRRPGRQQQGAHPRRLTHTEHADIRPAPTTRTIKARPGR